MKQIMLTAFLCTLFYVANAGIVITNWPCMGNNCIEVCDDGNIKLKVKLKTLSGVGIPSPNLLGIHIVSPSHAFDEFYPLSDFFGLCSSGPNSYCMLTKEISVPHTPSSPAYFEYTVNLSSQICAIGGGCSINNISISNNVWFANQNDPLIFPSTSESDTKTICPILAIALGSGVAVPKLSNSNDERGIDKNNSNPFLNIESVDNMIKIYPNPFKDELNIYFENRKSEKFNVEVFNIKGELVYQDLEFNNIFGQKNIFTSTFPNGIYICKIKNENEVHTYKLLKE